MSEYICDLPIDGMASFVSGGVTIPVRELVVRCRDCKHYESDYTDGAMFGATVCWAWDNGHDYPHYTNPDGFCHRGERREDA